MRRALALLAVCAAFGGVTAPAEASSYQQQATAAMTWTTYQCLRYTGCSSISFVQVTDNGRGCHSWQYNWHTTFYGWVYGWTPWYC